MFNLDTQCKTCVKLVQICASHPNALAKVQYAEELLNLLDQNATPIEVFAKVDPEVQASLWPPSIAPNVASLLLVV